MKRVELTPIAPHAGVDSDLHCTPEMTSTTPSLLHTTVSNCDYHITNVQTASHSQLINPVSFAAPMNPSLSSMPFVPWYNSSYNSNGSQMVQQFVSPPTFASPLSTFASPPHTFATPPPMFASPPHTFATPPPTFAFPAQKFYIKFIAGNISVGYGCRNRYSKSPMPPDDICLQTEEWRQFTPAGSLVPQTRWSNTYYHVSVNCVRHKWPMFDPQQVIVEESIQTRLVDSNREKILNELGLRC